MSRYIDGDALFSEVTNSYRWATGEARKAYRNVLDMICDADNKDVEIRHGKWRAGREDFGTYYVCSVCNKPYGNQYNYCPNCGAKMDKE